ncbi:hypothetical protein CRUP_020405 [Coryphaenoides rupestris]|nr:hypothetical protein CRUP_020405 [Coryphaenoides rupestris]
MTHLERSISSPRSPSTSWPELLTSEQVLQKGSNSWLSTGWFTMGLATEMCGTIHVFGMVPPDFCSSPSPRPPVPYHYYEPRGQGECVTYLSHERSRLGGHHRFITEKTVFASWAQAHDIRFHQPDWAPTSPQADRQTDAQTDR